MKKSELVKIIREVIELAEAGVPSNIAKWAKERGDSSIVNQTARWVEKCGGYIRDGQAIGKGYSTLVLIAYVKGKSVNIYINLDDYTIKINNELTPDFKAFKTKFEGN